MLDQERRRIDTNLSEEDIELQNFAWKIMRGNSENRCRQWLRRARMRHIEVQADWLKPEDEGKILRDSVRFMKEEL